MTFIAMLVDAYRQLNSKKLFWVTLAISGIVILFYASIGFNPDGMSMLFGLWNIENPLVSEGTPMARILYRGIFSGFIVGLWLAWVATILALISTTTIFPDFLAAGAIDLVLAKPISRVRLFVMKYLTSLLFVFLQVALFCGGIFLCMGWRIGEWNWVIFAAVPLITLFYSYLYAVNVLVGVVTRSALTALLITMVFWFSLFSVNLAEGIINTFNTQFEMELEREDERIAELETRLAEVGDADEQTPARTRIESEITVHREAREERAEIQGKIEPWHRFVRIVQAINPKTSETIGLVDRWLREDTDINIMDIFSGSVTVDADGRARSTNRSQDQEVGARIQEELDARSWWYIIGSSLAFEAVLLAIACFVFVRRDY